ncbi:Flp pilus assembly protein CpaB [Gimesia fumaroli]|uniref:SAF domain protein n=1 Tax=Gimesia fumaroli TaxID=2527976 RepID=A0A518IBC1_9PLAN|nr:Flp pilus assembly protein CpaB [Gimesia fumaroli]QDV50362.1 SAF domain protein [Gimesia fumaroli]
MAKISPGTMTAAIFAILLGLGAAYTVRQFMHKPSGPPVLAEDPAKPQQVIVPIASRDLVPGQTLSIDDISLYRMPPEMVDKKFNSEGKQRIMSTQYIAGRVLKTPIKAGQPFHTVDLFANGMGPGLSDILEPGNRAVTVAIHKIGNVAGFSRPGAVVDVLFRSKETDGIPETTITLLEKVKVLAVGEIAVPGHKYVRDQKGGKIVEDYSVTLEVSPEQGKVLKVVEDHGVLSLALRNPNENTEVVSAGRASDRLTLSNILGFIPNQRVSSMDIYRAGQLNTVHFKGNRAYKSQNWIDAIETPVASEVIPSNKATTTMKQNDRRTSEISTPLSGL